MDEYQDKINDEPESSQTDLEKEIISYLIIIYTHVYMYNNNIHCIYMNYRNGF